MMFLASAMTKGSSERKIVPVDNQIGISHISHLMGGAVRQDEIQEGGAAIHLLVLRRKRQSRLPVLSSPALNKWQTHLPCLSTLSELLSHETQTHIF